MTLLTLATKRAIPGDVRSRQQQSVMENWDGQRCHSYIYMPKFTAVICVCGGEGRFYYTMYCIVTFNSSQEQHNNNPARARTARTPSTIVAYRKQGSIGLRLSQHPPSRSDVLVRSRSFLFVLVTRVTVR